MENNLRKQHSERNSAIELLRIFAGMAIIVLHFNFWNLHVVDLTTGVTQVTLLFLESICVCAVNVFILISGYCSANSKKINVERLLNLVLQTSAFRFGFAVLVCVMHGEWLIKSLLGALLPVNYYVILYVALMLVAPFINLGMDKLSEKSLQKLMWISWLVFSIYPTIIDVIEECLGKNFMGLNSISIKGSIEGYTIVNFMLVYGIGVYIRKMDLVEKYNKAILKKIVCFSLISIFIWHELLPKTSYNYSNPLVILEACAIFMLFSKMNFRNRFINFVAPASFTCFLIHGYFLNLIGNIIQIEDSFLFVIGLLSVCVIGIYVMSVMVMQMWNFIFKYTLGYMTAKLSVVEIKEMK